MADDILEVYPIGYVRSALTSRHGAPRQPWEGAPEVSIEIEPEFLEALEGIEVGQDVWILTFLHQSERSTMKVHPRDEPHKPKLGVFSTRSPDRPNPIGLHRARVTAVTGPAIALNAFEAIDGTPVIDIKPVLDEERGG